MAQKEERRMYGVYPPFLPLGDAIDIARKIVEEAGGAISLDQLAGLLDQTIASSAFRRKVQVLKNYGLIIQTSPQEKVYATDIARKIIVPTTPEEKAQALKTAFLKIETYKKFYEQWAGKILPTTDEFMLNSIKEHGNVIPNLAKAWKESLMKSGETACLFHRREDGKIQMRLDPVNEQIDGEGDGSDSEEKGKGGATVLTPPPPPPPSNRDSLEQRRFKIPLLEGRVCYVELPQGWTQGDVKKLVKVVDVMFSDGVTGSE